MQEKELQMQASKRIAEALEILEATNLSSKQIAIIKKLMWRLVDELNLIKKVGRYEQFKK